MMRPLVLLVLLSSCAGSSTEAWPSLSRRPGEAAPLVQRPDAPAAAPVQAAAVVPNDTSDAAARLASIERDLTALKDRLETQLAVTVPRAGATGDAAAAAEIELTRLDRLGGQAAALRERLDAVAGDLARRSAGGSDVAAMLSRTGAAIEQVETLRAKQAAAFAAARR